MTIHHLDQLRDESPASRLGLVALDEMDDTPPRPLLLDRIDPEGQTILYGDGGIGKSTVAASWAVRLAQDGHRILILDYEGREREWSYRVGRLGGRGTPIYYAAPLLRGRVDPALWDHASLVSAIADEFEIGLVIVDSISAACHGVTPASDEAATKYHFSLQKIGRPVLSIAHVTKPRDGGNRLAKPYGSTHWHNLARITWSLSLEKGRVALTHRKANAYERQRAREVDFQRHLDPWVIDDSLPFAPTILDDILSVIREAPTSRTELMSRLSKHQRDSVRKALKRAIDSGTLAEADGLIREPGV